MLVRELHFVRVKHVLENRFRALIAQVHVVVDGFTAFFGKTRRVHGLTFVSRRGETNDFDRSDLLCDFRIFHQALGINWEGLFQDTLHSVFQISPAGVEVFVLKIDNNVAGFAVNRCVDTCGGEVLLRLRGEFFLLIELGLVAARSPERLDRISARAFIEDLVFAFNVLDATTSMFKLFAGVVELILVVGVFLSLQLRKLTFSCCESRFSARV